VTADEVIRLLDLRPHPEEGGWYRETYRSEGSSDPGPPFHGPRSVSTAIYYLLTPDTFSALHRLPGDEVFHAYAGDPVEMLELHPDGTGRVVRLGTDLESTVPQHVVRGGVWQGSALAPGGEWALLGTTMAPGFDFDDYEAGTEELVHAHPDWEERIRRLLPPSD
jgi:hypothetical protein